MNNEKFVEFIRLVKEKTDERYPLSIRRDMADEILEDKIEEIVLELSDNLYMSFDEKIEAKEQVYSSIRGFGILDQIINDDRITEVMINGPDDVFIEKDGQVNRLKRTFENEKRLEDIIQRIVELAGREVNESNPIVDTRLPDGSRVNVVLKPIAMNGPIITIRKFSKVPMSIDKLIEYKSISKEIAEVLQTLVRAKYNIFICGGTGSGKTTFLNALSNYIPNDERVITIEDSAELQLTGIENLVSLETRNANSSGSGEITIRELIKSSLRMRPERIVVGEVRGAEAIDMLQAMNTGHDGSLSTGHANSAKDMLSRLETMVLTSASELPLKAVRQQVSSAIDIIVHLSRLRDKSRRTMEIIEIVGLKDGEYVLNKLYEFVETSESSLEQVVGGLVRTDNPLINDLKLKLSGIGKEI